MAFAPSIKLSSETFHAADIEGKYPQRFSSEKRDDEGRVVLPVINRGRIVRTFRDIETNYVCHGISFCGEEEVEEPIEDLVNKIMSEKEDDS